MLQYRHGCIYFAHLNSPYPALNLLFSGNGPVRCTSRVAAVFVPSFPLYGRELGNWSTDSGVPIFYNLVDRFLVVVTLSVASAATSSDQSEAEAD